jgi:hypothetical protein
MDAWQAAEGIFTQLSLLSPATNVLGLAFAKSFAATEQLDAEEIEHAFFVVMMAGYATRTVFAETVGQPSIDPDALPISKPEDGTFDSEAIARDGEAVRALADPVGALAFTEFWQGYDAPARRVGGLCPALLGRGARRRARSARGLSAHAGRRPDAEQRAAVQPHRRGTRRAPVQRGV